MKWSRRSKVTACCLQGVKLGDCDAAVTFTCNSLKAHDEALKAFRSGDCQLTADLLLRIHQSIFSRLATEKEDLKMEAGRFRTQTSLVRLPDFVPIEKLQETLSPEVSSYHG